MLTKLPKPTTPEEKRAYRKEKKRRAKLSRPLTPEQRKEKNQRENMKDKAARLSIADLGGGMYQVWGGRNAHLVVNTDGWVTCDCEGWGKALNHNCSHVMKFRLTYGDLKK